MSQRYYLPPESPAAFPDPNSALPIDRPVAVYYRQSTVSQVGNISTLIQTVDMVEYLKSRGWPYESIILIDMDEGVSGSKKIDERAGMRMLFSLISEGKIGAVACQDEDRLFRDVTQIQVNIFIEACRASHVLVLTPSMVYDFANELTGTFHARQFRFKSEMAAEYINSFVRGRLHRAKKRLALEGRWAGGSIPVGFMVDMRKTLPDGSPNENWRRYVSFKPYTEVINQYFDLFLATGGNFAVTFRQIYAKNLAYPDPTETLPPPGFKVYYGLKKRKGRFLPGRSALATILTNAAYIGYWVVNDAVVRWDNHPAIVPLEKFMRAFNYRSEYDFLGKKNREYRPYRQYSRPSLEEQRPVERPLCAGMIISEVDGQWISAGTEYVKREEHYKYILQTRLRTEGVFDEYIWSKRSDWVDEAIVKRLHDKLKVTFDSEVWQQNLDKVGEILQQERKLKTAQLVSLERAMENMVASVETLTTPQLVQAIEARYQDAVAEYQRLKSELDTNESESQRLNALHRLRNNYEPTIANWEQMSRDEKCVLLQSFIDRIEATPHEKHGLQLTVVWRDQSRDTLLIPRLPTKGDGWDYEATIRLAVLLDSGASQVEIASAFPKRKWRMIRDKIFRMRGSKATIFSPKPIRSLENYPEFITRTGGSVDENEQERLRWSQNEVELLVEMLDNGSTKTEIARAFPFRKWTHLRTKVSHLKGHDFEIPGDKPMRSKETFNDYQKRAGLEQGECLNYCDSNMGSCSPSMMTATCMKCWCWKGHRRV
jgi:DNA invertase Pin-like site-specific DNA recombinase